MKIYLNRSEDGLQELYNFININFMKMKTLFLAFWLSLVFAFSGIYNDAAAQHVEVIGITSIEEIDGHNVPALTSGLSNVKLVKIGGTPEITGSEIGSSGYYEFDFSGAPSGYEGFYKLYINGVEKEEFGTIQIATFLDIEGSIAMSGEINMGGNRINSLGNPVTGPDAVNLSYLQANYLATTAADTHYVTRGTTQTIYGAKTFSNTVVFSGSTVATSSATTFTFSLASNNSNYPTISRSGTYQAPETDIQIATKKYVDDAVVGITVTPYQESVNLVRLMPGQTVQTNQVYLNYTNAANSFTSPSATRQCAVFIPGTGNTTQYVEIPTNSLRNYVNTVGAGKHINLLVGTAFTGSASVTKTTNFENATLWFGANDIAGDRTWNSATFIDCDIYAYRNVTFTNCTLINVRIFQNSTYGITLDGSTSVTDCSFMQEITLAGGFAGTITNTSDQVSTSYTMPTDPSISGIEE